MSVSYYFPNTFSKKRLDRYLAGGWFRHNSFMFKSKVICLDGGLHTLINIRIELGNHLLPKSLKKIKNTNDGLFEVKIQKACIDPQRERLYYFHKTRFKGFIYDSLEEFFYPGIKEGHFDTYEIAVYSGARLVAVSFFDTGMESLASLLALYDPEFHAYSPGFYTMLLEMEYASANGLKYYYPGYVVHDNPCFDYKLRPGNVQYYDMKGEWESFPVEREELYGVILNNKIDGIKKELEQNGIPCKKLLYPYFSFGYVTHYTEKFVKSPVFLVIGEEGVTENAIIIEYFPDEDRFTYSRTAFCDFENMAMQLRPHREYENSELYCNRLLVYRGPGIHLHNADDIREIFMF